MKLIKILSDKIQIKTDQLEFKDVRINNLIKISDGDVDLLTTVTSLTDSDTGYAIGNEDFIGESISVKVIECSIIGSIEDGKFSKAIEKYPTTDITAEEVTADEFAAILNDAGDTGFFIGRYASYNCKAFVDGNKFFQRHSCIVGNTGSGKSETVARILEETAELPSANLIVFDIHGEYRNLSYARNIKIGKTYPFPVWMFGFTDMVVNILKLKEETSTVMMSALRKCYYKICPGGKENQPYYFSYKSLIYEMENLNTEMVPTGEYYKSGDKEGMPKFTKGDFNGKLSSAINMLKDKQSDSRYDFLFMDDNYMYFENLMSEIMDNDKPVKNIDLSDIPHDVAIPIIGAITKMVYGMQLTYNMDSLCPITLVCDEAHVYIPNSFQLSASERRMTEIFENIAKEGRKFGVTLFVASQRPSELNKTIMAQCSNFIVSKLNNENDKSMVKGMLPDGSDSVIDSTTTFAPGEVLIIGDSVQIPLKIKVELAKERPQSRTIAFWDRWKKEH